MITKKIGLTYTFLFLFAFTFALSFTLASQAQAQGCCPMFDCEGHPEYQSGWGHWQPGSGCIQNGMSGCDFWFKSCP